MNRSRPFSITFHHDLAVTLGLSLLLILAIYLLPVPTLRLILGGPFVLFFPGYTMVSALFPGRKDLEGLERLGLSLGLGIAILPLMGLVLNYTPIGITVGSTMVSGSVFIAVSSAVAYYRRGRLPLDERYALRLELDVPGWRQSGVLDKALTATLAVSIVATVGTFLFVLAKPDVGERFTEFYVLDPYGGTAHYNEWVVPGQLIRPIVGVINREHQELDYRVRVEAGGQQLEEVTGIHLAHDEQWEQRVVLALQEPGDQQRLEFLLFREEQKEPYRSVHLWIDVVAGPTAEATRTPGDRPTPTSSPTSGPSATPTPAELPTQTPRKAPTATPTALVIHVVQPGETIFSIAQQYGLTTEALLEANGMDDPNLLELGQELVIPPAG